MPTFKEVLAINEKYALDNGKEDTAVKLLLLHFSGLNSSELLFNIDQEMNEDAYQNFLYGVDKYITKNIPVQHIIGTEYFFGYEFIVNKHVLIPRFETEELVANMLLLYDDVFDGMEVDLVDIGTGSGCLAITLDKEEKNMRVTATDISNEALAVARENNQKLKANVTFLQGDMLEPLKGKKFDIIISNPPYIPNEEYVDSLVKENEPHVALFGGEDGLDFYKEIINGADTLLNDKFIIGFEHAYNKAKEIKELIRQAFDDVEIIQLKDLQGKDRMTFAIKR